MRYILNKDYFLRGWQDSATGLVHAQKRETVFLPQEEYRLLMMCDGVHDIDEGALSEKLQSFLVVMKREEIIREARFFEFLKQEQEYRVYPAPYKSEVQWSVTGACNLKCRHCFMSAPHAKHGSPDFEQLAYIADQLEECGIFSAGLTGGEPLIRDDLLQLIDLMHEKGIAVSTLYTNGWLVNEELLDALEDRNMRPAFQLSYDGIGRHDFLRGIPGAEEKTLRALQLLKDRGYNISVSMCMHRKNRDVLRESVRLLASYGVKNLKLGSMMDLGEWSGPELQDLHLTRQEELEMYEKYIPEYFEDDAPLPIMMGDAFMYMPGDKNWYIYNVRPCSEDQEASMLSCGVLKENFYIGADGMAAPCMGMCDCGYAVNLPNLFKTPLLEILKESELTRISAATVREVRDNNPKCRTCPYVDRCTGGCRNAVLIRKDDYLGIDENVCYFFENGWEKRIAKAAEVPFAEYLKRNPPKEKQELLNTDRMPDCP